MKQANGFSLIELIAVIVILGVIAAIAVPRFVDLSGTAKEATAKSLAGNLGSGSAINFVAHIGALEDLPGLISPVPIEQCSDAQQLLEFGLPTGYDLEASEGASETVANMQTTSCDVFNETDTDRRASFILHGVSFSAP